jgi:hypothetical protein
MNRLVKSGIKFGGRIVRLLSRKEPDTNHVIDARGGIHYDLFTMDATISLRN